jgi:leader peptidase (prepilin peptidase)/N-methyltransferase
LVFYSEAFSTSVSRVSLTANRSSILIRTALNAERRSAGTTTSLCSVGFFFADDAVTAIARSHCDIRWLNSPNPGVQTSAEWWVAHTLAALAMAILGFLLIGLLVMDWQTMILPDAFTLTGIAIALFLICTQAIFLGPNEDQIHLTKHSLHLTSPGGVTDNGNVFLTGPESLIFGRIAATCGAALLLLLIRWLYRAIRHREGMGLGDVKLLAMIAAFLGFWPAILSLFLGTLLAALYGLTLLARGRAGAASRLAFGSFLCAGGLISAQFGNRLINMYIALLR